MLLESESCLLYKVSFEEVEGYTIIPNKVRFESNSEVFVIVSGQYPSCNWIKLFIFTFQGTIQISKFNT